MDDQPKRAGRGISPSPQVWADPADLTASATDTRGEECAYGVGRQSIGCPLKVLRDPTSAQPAHIPRAFAGRSMLSWQQEHSRRGMPLMARSPRSRCTEAQPQRLARTAGKPRRCLYGTVHYYVRNCPNQE